MHLKELIGKKSECADYMVDEITHIIKTFEKRPPGSNGEKQAAEYMADELKKMGWTAKVEPFDLHPGAFYGWIYYTVTLMLISLILAFFIPVLSLVLMVIGVFIMIAEFVMYRQLLDPLFKKKTSHNVIAVKKPTGEVKRRLVFNGHIDAAPEWVMNYHFGGVGFVAHFIIAITGILVLFAAVIAAIAVNGSKMVITTGLYTQSWVNYLLYATIVFVPAWILMYWLWSKKVVVDGANDNLTGCYIGMAIAYAMNKYNVELENTEIAILQTGSEEAGLRGAKAFGKAHQGEWQDVPTYIISYDTLHEMKYHYINILDLNNTVKSDKYISELYYQAAKNLDINCIKGTVPLGATDNAAFNQYGFKATGITALNHNLQNYYHTRRDTYDNLDKECLADIYAVSVETLRMFDEGWTLDQAK